MNAQAAAQLAAQRIERLRDLPPDELRALAPALRALVRNLRLPVKTNTGGHDKRTLVQFRDDILTAWAARYVAGPRLVSLPVELAIDVLGYAGLECELALACTSHLMRDRCGEVGNLSSEMLVACFPTEARALLKLQPRATPLQLYHMFATKRKLRTNIKYHYGESPEPLDNSPDRLVFVLSFSCGLASLLRWDEKGVARGVLKPGARRKAITKKELDKSLKLATLHVIDTKTFKCATIFSNKEYDSSEYDSSENKNNLSFMVPHIIRHNYSREFEDSTDLPDVPEDDAVAELCVMNLDLYRKTKTKKIKIRAILSDNSEFAEYPWDWVTVFDQGDCMREIFADAIKQTHEAG